MGILLIIAAAGAAIFGLCVGAVALFHLMMANALLSVASAAGFALLVVLGKTLIRRMVIVSWPAREDRPALPEPEMPMMSLMLPAEPGEHHSGVTVIGALREPPEPELPECELRSCRARVAVPWTCTVSAEGAPGEDHLFCSRECLDSWQESDRAARTRRRAIR